jgi:endonuclease YncB( thermonuclease family)
MIGKILSKVMYDGEPTSVRFFAMHAPERSDPDGPAATKALNKLIDGKTVRIESPGPKKRGNFGRLLCKVYVGDTDVGAEMIRLGHGSSRPAD